MTPRRSDDKTPLTVDARGMRCPWPVLRAARAMRDAHDVLLIADDPIARRDIPEMAAARGWCCTVTEKGAAAHFILSKMRD